MTSLIVLSRLMDVISTLLVVNKWGHDVEANPILRFVFSHGDIWFVIYQTIFTLLLIRLYQVDNRAIRLGVKLFVVLSLVQSLLNFSYYFLIV
jgi:hypothetical protein